MMPQADSGPAKIAILGGDLLVGRALEVILRGVGYDARYLNGSFTGEPAELPDGVELVILAPRISAERRKAFLDRARGTPATAGVPVLELFTASAAPRNGWEERVNHVAWPCPRGELEREIEAVLLDGADPQQQ
jgi:hypothetical protein